MEHANMARYLLLSCLVGCIAATTLHPLSDEFIELINQEQNGWTAGRNFPEDTSLEYIKRLCGSLPYDDKRYTFPVMVHDEEIIANLPDNFHPKDKWPECSSLTEIRDQGACASAWALSPVAAMTDRYCIYSNGTKNFHFSVEELVSCCEKCGNCYGGWPLSSWIYWSEDGIVSGGNYNSNEGCYPYEIPPCEHWVPGKRNQCNETNSKTPTCQQKCRAGYNMDFKKDKQYAKKVYRIFREDHIRAELLINGPVAAYFTVYADLLSYRSGVYRHTKGDKIGGHTVKIMGWGVENGTKYWLIANSWNTDWGDNGYFKIFRGEDHCRIESEIAAGEPLFS